MTAAGATATAIIWIFTKMPETYSTWMKVWLGFNPTEIGCPALVRRLGIAVVQMRHMRDTDPSDITVDAATEYIENYDAIQSLCASSLVIPHTAVTNTAHKMMDQMRPFIESCRSRLGQVENRKTPVGLLLFGKPGIGKSTIIPLLASGLFPEYPENNRCFTKNMRSDYWEGCKKDVPMIYFDEPHAASGVAVEAFNIDMLSMISNASYVLNYAGMENKGKICLNAKLIALSSNGTPLSPVRGLNCAAAFRRRFMYVEVVLDPAFALATGEIDTVKVNALPLQDKVSLTHLRFVIHKINDYSSGSHTPTIQLCLHELIRILQAKLVQNANNYESVREVVESPLTPQQLPPVQAIGNAIVHRAAARDFPAQVERKQDPHDRIQVQVGSQEAGPYIDPPKDPYFDIIVAEDRNFTAGQTNKVLEEIFKRGKTDIDIFASRLAEYLPKFVRRNFLVQSAGSLLLKFAKRSFTVGSIDSYGRLMGENDFSYTHGPSRPREAVLSSMCKDFSTAITTCVWFSNAVTFLSERDRTRGLRYTYGPGRVHGDNDDYASSELHEFLNALNLNRSFQPINGSSWIHIILCDYTRELKSFRHHSDDWAYTIDALERANEILRHSHSDRDMWNQKWSSLCSTMASDKNIICKGYEWAVYGWTRFKDITCVPTSILATQLFDDVASFKVQFVNTIAMQFKTIFTVLVGSHVLVWIIGRMVNSMMAQVTPANFSPESRAELRPDLEFDNDFAGSPYRPKSLPQNPQQTQRVQPQETFDADAYERWLEAKQEQQFEGNGMDVYDWPHGPPLQMGGRMVMPQNSPTIPPPVLSNQIRISLITEDDRVLKSVTGLGIAGSLAIFPSHFFKVTGSDGLVHTITQDYSMLFERQSQRKKLAFDHNRLIHWVDETGSLDLVGYDFGLTVEAFKNITKHFAPASQHNYSMSTEAIFSLMGQDPVSETATMNMSRRYYNASPSSSLIKETYVCNFWNYSCKKYGDCGAILYCPEKGILAMHVASQTPYKDDPGDGMGARLDKETVQRFLDGATMIVVQTAPSSDVLPLHPSSTPDVIGDSVQIGRVRKSPYAPDTTDYIPMPYGEKPWCKTNYLPAVLGPRDKNSPGHSQKALAEKSYAKLCRTVAHFPSSVVKKALSDMTDLMDMITPSSEPTVQVEVDAINGNLEHLQGIDMTTSPGYVFNQEKPANVPGKGFLFSPIKPRHVVNKKLRETLDLDLSHLKAGLAPQYIADYNFKEEMRASDRVLVPPGQVPSTRGICASPINETILTRQYFNSVINEFHKRPGYFDCCVGGNIFSLDWQRWYLKLTEVSDVGFATDYSGHETNCTSQMLECFAEFVETFYRRSPSYNPEDRLIRLRLLYSICYHRVRLGPRVFMKSEHLLTGCVLTAILNSFVTSMHFRIAFIMLSSEQKLPLSIADFKTHVKMLVYGDDNAISVSRRIPWFNASTISTLMARYGIVMTMADKQAAVTSNFVPIRDLSFLKCTTIMADYVPGQRFYPLVEMESIHKMLSWCKCKNLEKIDMIKILGDNALHLVWTHGSKVFNELRQEIIQVWKECGITDPPLNYEVIQSRWINGQMPIWSKFTNDTKLAYSGMINYRPRVLPPHRIVPQMLSAEIIPPVEDIKTPPITLPTSSPATTAVVIEDDCDSLGNLLKRKHPVHYGEAVNNIAFPLASLFVGDQLNCISAFKLWAPCFYGFIGDINLLVVSEDPTDIITGSYSDNQFVQKRGIGVSQAIQMGPAAMQRSFLSIKCPMLTQNQFVMVPKSSSDIGNPAFNFGYVNFNGLLHKFTIFASLGDQSRFFGHHLIPRLSFRSENYPHDGTDVFDVPEFITLYNNSGAEEFVPPSQSWADQWTGATGVASATFPGPVGILNGYSRYYTDAQLRSFGFNIRDNQARNILTGALFEHNVRFVDSWAVPTQYTINGSITTTTSAQYNFEYKTANTPTTIYVGGLPIVTANSFVVNDYTNTSVRKMIGVPTNKFIFRSPTTVAAFKVVTGPAGAVAPGILMVSREPPLGFKPPVLEEKADILPQSDPSTNFANEVILHSEGMIPSSARNVAAGGLVPNLTTDLPARPAIIANVPWSSSATVGDVMYVLSAPRDIINPKSSKPAFDSALFWSGKIRLTLKLTANQFMAGKLGVFWSPLLDGPRSSIQYSGRLASADLLPHVVMYASVSGVIEFDVPFIYPKYAISTLDPSAVLGCFLFIPMSTLLVGPASPVNSINISVMGSFIESKFSLLNPRYTPQGNAMYKSINYNLSNVGSNSIDASGTHDEFKGGDPEISLNDCPTISITPPPVMHFTYPNMSSSSDIVYASFMGLTPNSLPHIKSSVIGSTTDEMSLKAMRERPGYVGRFVIHSLDPLGKGLYFGDLCPCEEFFVLGRTAVFDLPLLSFACIGSSYWQGDIIYDFEFIATSYHKMDVAICSAYGLQTSIDADLIQRTSQYTTHVQISGPSTKVRVVFPWTSNTPMKRVPNGTYPNSDDFSMGTMSVIVTNPMQFNETVSPDIECIVYKSMRGKTFFYGNSFVDLQPVEIESA